jgi:hypothetical protein
MNPFSESMASAVPQVYEGSQAEGELNGGWALFVPWCLAQSDRGLESTQIIPDTAGGAERGAG